MMKEQYVKNCESTENNQLSDLSSDVVGIKTAKFAVVPTSKITLASTDACGTDYNLHENEPFSKRQALAAKYGLTMRKHGKPARQSLKQVKKTEVNWTEKQIDKYNDIGN